MPLAKCQNWQKANVTVDVIWKHFKALLRVLYFTQIRICRGGLESHPRQIKSGENHFVRRWVILCAVSLLLGILFYWVVVQILAHIGPPPPIPGGSKSLLPGGKQIKKNHIFDDFLWLIWKVWFYHLYEKVRKVINESFGNQWTSYILFRKVGVRRGRHWFVSRGVTKWSFLEQVPKGWRPYSLALAK